MPDRVRHDDAGRPLRRHPGPEPGSTFLFTSGSNPKSSARSRHVGFPASISATFHARGQFDLLLAGNRPLHRPAGREPHQPPAPVARREPAERPVPMLVDALNQVRRDAGIDRPVKSARHDVDGPVALHRAKRRKGGRRIKPGATAIRNAYAPDPKSGCARSPVTPGRTRGPPSSPRRKGKGGCRIKSGMTT